MNEATMICETTWGEPPSRIVFKGHDDWPWYVPERTCDVEGCYYDDLLDMYVTSLSCGHQISEHPEYISFCLECGARVL